MIVNKPSRNWELHLGDCIEGMKTLADKSVDHVICDPPYSAHVHGNARSTDGAVHEISFDHLEDELRTEAAVQFSRLARRWVIVFCEEEGAHLWRRRLKEAGLEYIRTGRWVRTNGMPQITGDRPAQGDEAIVIAHPPGRKKWNGGGRPAIYNKPLANNDGERIHPTQKPESLMESIVRDFTNRGDLVLDAFSGSGTTGVACIRNGRRFVGWEKNEEFHSKAFRRLSATREQMALELGE